LTEIFDEIAQHAATHKDWLDLSSDF